jgi:flagellar biosynthesis/type III secretory pathway protein FliH
MQGEGRMTKQEMTALLRSVGVNENTITAMENAWELGYEQGVKDGVEKGKAEIIEDLAGGGA